MKGKLFQKSIALVLVLCMTLVNFLFVAVNTVYAVSGSSELEGGNIVFKAYYKGVTEDNQTINTSSKTADLSEGDNLFVSILVKQGKLQDAKIRIENGNFKIDEEKVDKRFIKNISQMGLLKEVSLNEINYNDCNGESIEIALPIVFEETNEIDTSYFEMENNITLSGNYINSSENGKAINSESIKTNLIWKLLNKTTKFNYKPNNEKVIYLNNATLVQVSLDSLITENYFPKETEIVTFNLPKVNGVTPKYTLLVNGDKIDKNQITAPVGSEEITYTNNFIKNGKIAWNKAGDNYRIIYVYEGVTELGNQMVVNCSIQSKLYNRQIKDKQTIPAFTVVNEKGTISTVKAEAKSKDVYKGFMYAGTNNTEYKENYEMELSYIDGITAELDLAGEKFKTENGDIDTNKTQIKEIVLNKADLLKVLGDNGTLTITPDNSETNQISINKSTQSDENGNIVTRFQDDKMPHSAKIKVENAANEGTIRINITKQIIGNAGLDKEALKQIKALETTVITRTNKDKEGTVSTARATTELKETTTEVNLTMNNNNSNTLSEAKTNNVEFTATIKTATMDADLVTNPTIKIQLPEEVTNIENVVANVFFAGENVAVESSVEEKAIIVRLQGNQLTNGNAFVEGIQIKINADITVADIETTKDTNVILTYTNESSAQSEYTKQLPITIIASEAQNAQTEPTNPATPSTEPSGETLNSDKLRVNVEVKSADKELKNNDEVYESQVIRYTYYLTNTSNEDITNVKITANHENANVFDLIDGSSDNTLEGKLEKETKESSIERTIETLKPGQTEIETYQVRVKNGVNNVKANATISGTGIENIQYSTQNTVKTAELRVEILNNRLINIPASKGDPVNNAIIITNFTNNTLNNVLVNVEIPSEFNVEYLVDDNKNDKDYTSNNSNKTISFSIDKIESQQTATYTLGLEMNDNKPTVKSVYLKAKAKVNEQLYHSNELEIRVLGTADSSVTAELKSTIEENILKTGDKPTFVISIKNTSEVDDTFFIKYSLPNAAIIKRAYIINNNREIEKEIDVNKIEQNTIIEDVELNANSIKHLVVETEIDESQTPLEEIEFNATISGYLLPSSVNTQTITYKLQANIPYHPDDDVITPEPEPTEEPIPGSVETKYNISGIVWVDQNKNGVRESNEKTLPGIKVILANDLKNKSFLKDENGNIVEATTNEYGEYKFSNLPNGEYMAVFAFDNVKYRSTEYHSPKATDKTNSDITTSKLLTNSTDIKYGLTDTLVIKDKSLENIDAGLIENEIFDLSMNKYINKVTVQNSSGTTVKEYNKQKLAKLEIDSKNLAGSTLLVEYDIDVKNEGEIAGYANEIMDYMPKDLTFSSELNKDWYISTDGNLHTTTLSKELIEPGETKTVTLILTKTMTEKNTGLTSNKAEIVKSTNEMLIPDRNSNNNSSTGELIVSIRTGVDTTIGIIITLIAIATTGIVVYTRARKGVSHE